MSNQIKYLQSDAGQTLRAFPDGLDDYSQWATLAVTPTVLAARLTRYAFSLDPTYPSWSVFVGSGTPAPNQQPIAQITLRLDEPPARAGYLLAEKITARSGQQYSIGETGPTSPNVLTGKRVRFVSADGERVSNDGLVGIYSHHSTKEGDTELLVVSLDGFTGYSPQNQPLIGDWLLVLDETQIDLNQKPPVPVSGSVASLLPADGRAIAGAGDTAENLDQVAALQPALRSPFLDTPVPLDWTIAVSDRALGVVSQRPIEVRRGEEYIAAWDCLAIMARGQASLYGMDLPTVAGSGLTITPTTDTADPQHGTSGRLAKFKFTVDESATIGSSHTIEAVIQPNQHAKINAELTVKVIA